MLGAKHCWSVTPIDAKAKLNRKTADHKSLADWPTNLPSPHSLIFWMRLAVLSGFLNLLIPFVMEGGTAAGFTSLAFTTFRGCIRAYEFLQAAQDIGKHGEFLESKLQWEQYRLSQWGDRAGLG